MKSGFKRTINWNKYQSKVTVQERNRYLDVQDTSLQGVNRLFVLSFENTTGWTSYKRYYLPEVEIKNFNVMTHDNIRKIATSQGDDYTNGCLLDYPYFKNYYKMIATDLSKQQALDVDPKAIKQINSTASLEGDVNTRIFFIIEEAKDTILDFSQETVKVLWIYFYINIISI